MQNNNSTQPRRSLGALRKTPKTKEKSPDTQGTMKLQRHTFDELSRQFVQTDGDELIVCIAGWFHQDHSGQYLSVELSPRYVSRQQVQREDRTNMFDAFYQDKERLH
jgi:hypothetical protein